MNQLENYTYQQLIQAYSAATSERHKAEIEDALWETTTIEQRRKYPKGRRRFIHEVLGVSQNSAALRGYLSGALHADLLWDRIADGMGLETAARLHRAARSAAPSKASLRATLVATIEAYDKMPSRKFKRHPPSKQAALTRTTYEKTETRQFWTQLRKQLSLFMQSELPDTDVVEDRLWAQFETDIKSAMDDFKRRVVAAAKRRAADGQVTSYTRRHIRNAFETLCLDVPRKGKPIDLKAVSRNKRKLARMYHPDATGDESMRDTYEAVLDAAALIEDLAAQRGQ